MRPIRPRALTAAALAAALALTACSRGEDPDRAAVEIQSTESTCQVTPSSIPAGTVTITAQHIGTLTADVRIETADGRLVGSADDVGERVTGVFEGRLDAGEHTVTCVPDSGDPGGITATLTVE